MSDAATIERVTVAVRTLREILAVVEIPDALHAELWALAHRIDELLMHERAEGVPAVAVREIVTDVEAIGARVRAYTAV